LALARNRAAMILALLLAGSLALLALRLGLFETAPLAGVVENPCPQVDHTRLGQAIERVSGRTSRQRIRDWGDLCAYGAANHERLARGPIETVMIGDSITANWYAADPDLFADTLVNRGIGGQMTPQVLLRFYQDTVALRPRTIHLMIGINDLAGVFSLTTRENIHNNIRAMADIAKANQIPLIIASTTPVRRTDLLPRQDAAQQIVELNRWLAAFAAERGIVYANYHAVLSEPCGRSWSLRCNRPAMPPVTPGADPGEGEPA